MHARGIEPTEEGFAGCHLPFNEVDRGIGGLVVDRLHALARQRTCVFDRLLADPPPARLLCGVIGLRSLAAEYPPRPEHLLEFWIGGIVEVLRLFLGIE